MRKPIIAISGSIFKEKQGEFANYPRSFVNEDYVQAIIQNGGIPMIIPINDNHEDLKLLLRNVDGLILSGGYDVYPYHYGEEPHFLLNETNKERDLFEYELLNQALLQEIPILGICRGLQLINTYFGGTLYQDISLSDSFLKHNQINNPTLATHSIQIEKESKLYQIIQEEEYFVNSFYHQVIKRLGEDLKVTATSSDGHIEAIESDKYSLIAVQFHPEMMFRNDEKMNEIFSYFISKTRKQEM